MAFDIETFWAGCTLTARMNEQTKLSYLALQKGQILLRVFSSGVVSLVSADVYATRCDVRGLSRVIQISLEGRYNLGNS